MLKYFSDNGGSAGSDAIGVMAAVETSADARVGMGGGEGVTVQSHMA